MESETRKHISIVLIAVMVSLVFAAISLFALPNTQAVLPPPSPTPTPTPPEITSFAPPSPVNDMVGNWRTFNVTVNQTVNVSWYLDDSPSPLHTNDTVKAASYTLRALTVGKHYVNASAVNVNGSDMQPWIWNVTAPPCCYCGDICVNENGWWRFGGAFNINDTPIQAAVDNAIKGETICVKDGTYDENVDVYKHVTIKSENGPENCTVNALTSSDHVFNVTAGYVNITGFTVTGGYAGISLNGVDYGTISNNNVRNNDYGIYLSASDNNTLSDNIAFVNPTGIFLDGSNNNDLLNNNASDNLGGIYLRESNNNTLTGNTASDNYLCGILLEKSNHNTLTDNIALNNGYGTTATASENTILTDTIVGQGYYGMGTGIYLGGSNNNTLTGNTASDNYLCGILLEESNNNTLTSNIALNHREYMVEEQVSEIGIGIFLGGSNNNTLSENIVYNNTIGIGVGYSSDNNLTENTASVNVIGIAIGYESGYVYYSGGANNTLSGNTASNNYGGGIYLRESDNNDLTDNTASNNYLFGIYLVVSNNNMLTDNTASGNERGIVLEGDGDLRSFASGNELGGFYPYGSNNNILNGNTASSNTAYDFYSNEYAYDNIVDELLISSYPTTISFTYDNGVGIKGVTTPHPNPADKENIGKYVNATNVTETSWVFLKVHYSDADVTDIEEDSLRLYHWNESTWEAIPGSNVNTGDNYVYGNVTSFCQIAPFGDPAPTPTPPPRGGGGGFKGSRDWDGDGFTDVEEALNDTDWHDPCDPDPYCDACLRPPTPPPTPTATPTTPPKQASVPPPVATPTPPTPEPPGFNVLYAILAFLGIAGLLGGAYYFLVLNQ
jgi:parallel beta-helix repeat protein